MRARLIFATHQDLASKVAQGTFRQDLLYRIDVVRITVPPLRERVEDIPMLADYFMQIYSKKFGLPLAELDADTVVCLEEQTWPGNVRELEHVIQSSVIMSRGQAIRPHHLPEQLASDSNNIVGIDGHSAGGSFDEQLAWISTAQS